MKPAQIKSKIFLDSGDPEETKQLLSILGFLDGQTTNPTLIAKNPDAKDRLERGEKFSEDEIYDFYKGVVSEISELIPNGSVSIEVYADNTTKPETMLAQGKEMYGWIHNAHVKYPTTKAGLAAAEQSIYQEMRVNMTLCFSEEQAAAIYSATKGAKRGDVFVSPFIGRLDDIGQNGMSLISNIQNMYSAGNGHVEVLAASVRTYAQLMQCLKLEADIITAPFSVLSEWGKAGMPMPDADFEYITDGLEDLPFQEVDISKPWTEYDISHVLTDKGIDRFASDWNALIG